MESNANELVGDNLQLLFDNELLSIELQLLEVLKHSLYTDLYLQILNEFFLKLEYFVEHSDVQILQYHRGDEEILKERLHRHVY